MTTAVSKTSGSADQAISRYLRRCRTRIALIARFRIAVAGVAILAALTIAFAAIAAYLVPSHGWIVGARILLYAIGVATIVVCVVRRVGSRRAAHHVERRIPAFDGRLTTWIDASRRQRRPALLPHLAEHALGVAKAHPPRRAAPTWLLLPPLAVLAAAVVTLYLSYEVAPASWRLPAERLWTGDLLADTRPKILVEPGDTVVPRGTDVLVRAQAHGFAAATMAVNASFAGSGSWERATMIPTAQDGSHEFVLVAVNEPVVYYVSAGGTTAASRLNSDRFRIEVADLPVVEDIELALDYPAWTRLESTTQNHGDVAAADGTRVGVRIQASRPLDDAHLVVNDEQRDLDDGVGGFTIDRPGTWHVAVKHRGAVVRISDEYLIDLVHDQPPMVEFAFPGRDRSATAIEEVVLRFNAKDDFGVESLTLRYAVNGSDWTSIEHDSNKVDLEAESSHTILLEDLAVGEGEERRPVRPGDVVSVHALAQDHRQSTKSALYFVDVRSFDKHYRDTGTSGNGNGGNGAGAREQELSSRQREIVNATWNLIQERDTGARAGSDLRDQVDLVAVLQQTLKEQVETLVARTQGRRLSDNNEVEPYVAELTNAAEQMEIAAETLTRDELDDAVQPEQRALQHLLTAEAGLRNVNVSLASRSSSAGDSVSRSLSELFDLETDPEQNRYETPQTPGGGGSERNDAEAEWRRLTELAHRNEELARAQEQSSRPEEPLSRWQLERLQRELERLRDRLADNSNQQSQPANRQAGGQAGARSSGTPVAGRPPSEDNPSPDLRGTLEDLDRARQAIERTLARGNDDRATQATAEAFRQGADALRQAADQLLEDQRESLAAGLRDAQRRAGALVGEQQRILTRLEALRQEVLDAVRQGRSYPGADFGDEAEAKRRMRDDVEGIAADVADLRQQLARSSSDDTGLTRLLDRALDDLTDSRVADQLTIAAEYFEMNRPLFVASRERRVHDALSRLSNRLGHALERLESANADSTAQATVADVQALRRQLTALGAGGDPRALGEIVDATGDLADEVLGAEGRVDLAQTRRTYRGLGANDANHERLYRLMLAELDQMEIALRKVDGTPVHAEEPRDEGYDSEAVAEYFRNLSSDS